MGLLDDAIREHLELKRLRGADPGEVAREQHEALAPVVPDDPSTWDAGHAPAEHEAPAGASDADAVDDTAGTEPGEAPAAIEVDAHEPSSAAEFSSVGQETAELDMRTVLHESDEPEPGTGSTSAPEASHAAGGASHEQDSLEWEMPVRAQRLTSSHESSAEAPAGGGEHGGSRQGWAAESGAPLDDERAEHHGHVPGQERLSFE